MMERRQFDGTSGAPTGEYTVWLNRWRSRHGLPPVVYCAATVEHRDSAGRVTYSERCRCRPRHGSAVCYAHRNRTTTTTPPPTTAA